MIPSIHALFFYISNAWRPATMKLYSWEVCSSEQGPYNWHIVYPCHLLYMFTRLTIAWEKTEKLAQFLPKTVNIWNFFRKCVSVTHICMYDESICNIKATPRYKLWNFRLWWCIIRWIITMHEYISFCKCTNQVLEVIQQCWIFFISMLFATGAYEGVDRQG